MAVLSSLRWLRPLVACRTGVPALLLLLAWGTAQLHGAGPASGNHELEVKAVFVFNFARFVQWPAEAERETEPVVIGVLGRDPFGPTLDAVVRGEKVGGRPLIVRRIARVEEALECHEVFISASEERDLPRILAFLDGKPVLTVSDIPDFAGRGGMIGLVPSSGRTRIQINAEVAKAAQLVISSKLLRPSEVVSTRRHSTTRVPVRAKLVSGSMPISR
ncbi:MAG TPA: YfiR family protein [Opitutus sp.]|nr:YfiR family protein [Opitutus sp.]